MSLEPFGVGKEPGQPAPGQSARQGHATAPRPCVVIPVYNHGGTLRDVVVRTLAHCAHVLVVDDGSTDGGPDTLHDLPVTVLRLPRNGGKGAALLAGARAAASPVPGAQGERAEQAATHIITLDADGQHYPEDLPRMLEALRRHPNAILVGARDFDTPHVPASSRFGRAFSGFWMRVQTGVRVSDMQSGFRVYPLQILHCLSLGEKGYAFEVEVLVRAAWAGFAVLDVPVRVLYQEAEKRISHFHALRDNARISLLNTRLTLRASRPCPFAAAPWNWKAASRCVALWPRCAVCWPRPTAAPPPGNWPVPPPWP